MAIPLIALALESVIIPAITWILRAVIIKFVLITCLFLLMEELMPYVIQHLTNFTNGQTLSAAFAGISPGLGFFLKFFRLDIGLPLLISAYTARFMIRRIPVVG
jgi:hypothetical protein